MKKRLSVLLAALPLAAVTHVPAEPSVVVERRMIVVADGALHTDLAMAINPTNPSNIIIVDRRGTTPNTECGFHATFDGGETWKSGALEKIVSWTPAQRTNPCTVNTGNNTDNGNPGRQPVPRIAFDPNGRAYYAGGLGVRAIVAVSEDGGATFGKPKPLGFGSVAAAAVISPPSVTVNPKTGAAHVFYEGGGEPYGYQGIYSSTSRDGGTSWSPPMLVGDRQLALFGWGASLPVVQPDGTVRVVYLFESPTAFTPSTSSGLPVYHLMLATSRNDGLTYEHPNEMLAELGGHNARTAFGSSPSGDHLYIVWGNWTGGHSGQSADVDLMFVRSLDNGATWSEPEVLNDDGPPNGPIAMQESPVMSVAPNGRIDLAWYDQRLDPRNCGGSRDSNCGWHDVYYAYSTNGGTTWSPNMRVSNASFRLRGHPGGEKGIAIASTNDNVLIAFERENGSGQDVLLTRMSVR